MDIVDRLLSRIKVDERGCFNWQGPLFDGGYAAVYHDGITQRGNRLSFEAFRGSIPDGLFVCHECDNPRCVNPAHLFLGTAKVNSQDSARKGRTAHGKRNARAKLTESQVVELVARYNAGEPGGRLRREFNLSSRAFLDLLYGRHWVRVDRPPVIRRQCGSRQGQMAGERNSNAKLTVDQVADIRKARSEGAKAKVLASRYGVHPDTISRICTNRRWAGK